MYGIDFSPDGSQLATVGDDFMLRVWSTEGFRPLVAKKLSSDALYAIAFYADGKRIAVGGAEATVYWEASGTLVH